MYIKCINNISNINFSCYKLVVWQRGPLLKGCYYAHNTSVNDALTLAQAEFFQLLTSTSNQAQIHLSIAQPSNLTTCSVFSLWRLENNTLLICPTTHHHAQINNTVPKKLMISQIQFLQIMLFKVTKIGINCNNHLPAYSRRDWAVEVAVSCLSRQ